MLITANPPIEVPLEDFTEDQKWRLFEVLWDELAETRKEEIEPPAWHQDALRERAEKIERGEAVWHDLDSAMAKLRSDLR